MVGLWRRPCPCVFSVPPWADVQVWRVSWSTGDLECPTCIYAPLPIRIWAAEVPGKLQWAEFLPGRCPRAIPLEALSKTHSLPDTMPLQCFRSVYWGEPCKYVFTATRPNKGGLTDSEA